MEEKERKELEELIKEGEKLSSDIKYSSGGDLVFPHYFFTDRKAYIEWLERCHYWTSINNKLSIPKIQGFYDNLTAKRVKKNEHPQLLNTLKAMLRYPQKNKPTISEDKKENIGVSIYNTNIHSQTQSQEQAQSQKLLQEVFLEAIKNDLTGAQVNELRAILDEHKGDIAKAKPKLKDKLLSFGGNVLSGIITNIVTNPAVLALLM